ncbi:MAG: hypothetical protein M1822_004544 [Bathelium mastoideum]|nr:MAG: hypothetical protein M1822_004544 [Bathelium mastoideum]
MDSETLVSAAPIKSAPSESSPEGPRKSVLDSETPKEDIEKQEEQKVHIEQEWESDIRNPKNWSPIRKWLIVALLAVLVFVATLATSMCTPASPQILQDLNCDDEIYLTLLVSIWELGEAFGPMLTSPLSELYGRLPVYHASNLLFILFSCACALSKSIGALVCFRFLNGACVMALSLNPSVIGDMFVQEQRGGALTVMMGPGIIGGVVAPVIGGYINQALGWRWVFWIGALGAGVAELALFLTLRETYKPVILHRSSRASHPQERSLQKSLSFQHVCSSFKSLMAALSRPFRVMLLSPATSLLSFFMGTIYGSTYLVFTMTTIVFETSYGVSEKNVGLTFLGQGVGMILAVAVCRLFLDRYIKKQKASPKGMQPEHRLPTVIVGGVLLPIGLFVFGWTGEKHSPILLPIFGTGIIFFSFILCSISTMGYLVDAFEDYSGSALAVMVVMRGLGATFLPMAGPALYGGLGLGWGNSLLAFVTIALLPIPVLIMNFGHRMKGMTKLEMEGRASSVEQTPSPAELHDSIRLAPPSETSKEIAWEPKQVGSA